MATSKSLVLAGLSVMAGGLVLNLVLDAVGSSSVAQAGTALFVIAVALGLVLIVLGLVGRVLGRVTRRRTPRRSARRGR